MKSDTRSLHPPSWTALMPCCCFLCGGEQVNIRASKHCCWEWRRVCSLDSLSSFWAELLVDYASRHLSSMSGIGGRSRGWMLTTVSPQICLFSCLAFVELRVCFWPAPQEKWGVKRHTWEQFCVTVRMKQRRRKNNSSSKSKRKEEGLTGCQIEPRSNPHSPKSVWSLGTAGPQNSAHFSL